MVVTPPPTPPPEGLKKAPQRGLEAIGREGAERAVCKDGQKGGPRTQKRAIGTLLLLNGALQGDGALRRPAKPRADPRNTAQRRGRMPAPQACTLPACPSLIPATLPVRVALLQTRSCPSAPRNVPAVSGHSHLTALHQLDEVVEEDVPVPLTEALSVVRNLGERDSRR